MSRNFLSDPQSDKKWSDKKCEQAGIIAKREANYHHLSLESLTLASAPPFEEQIRDSVSQLAQRAIRLYRLRAALWAVGLALVATLGFVGLDYSLHVEERGWRWLLSILWMATLAGIGWRWLPDATSFRITPIQVAQWIERRRPELGDRLSRLLAITEVPENDERYGSLEFRRAAVQSYDTSLSNLPWQSFLDKQPTLSAGLFCLVSLMAVSILAVTSGAIARQGLSRIALPWSWAPWPRSEQLQLVDAPNMIARGSELEVRVLDQHPPFPELVELEVHIDGTNEFSSSNLRLPMRVAQDLAVVTLPAMENDFSIRPIGGDQQDGPWHEVRVTREPQLKEYAFTVQPPAYVNQAPAELVGQRIDVLSGSRVSLRGRFDEPLKTLMAVPVVESKRKDQANTTAAAAYQAWSAQLAADGQSFELFTDGGQPWIVEEDRRWQFELETEDGLHMLDSKQWMVHVTTDRPPAITMAPIEPRGITRYATLNIMGTASDDLGLVEVELSWHVASQAPQSLRLWPTSNENATGKNVEPSTKSDARNIEVSSLWSAAMASLSVGQTLTVELVARDTAGQVGRSVPQTLEVLDEAAALAEQQRQQASTFGPLRQLLDAQRRNQQSLQRTVEVVRQLDKIGREEVDAVGSAHQLGQSIAGGLARNQDSLTRQLSQLSDQLERNQLGESQLAKDVARLKTQIEEAVKERLEPALKEIESAQQALRGSQNDGNHSAALDQLTKASQANQEATDRLAALVENVAAAESLSEVQKQIQELANEQSAVASSTEKLQVESILRGSSSQLDAQRAGIQSDQQNLARRVEEMVTRLQQESEPAKNSDKTTEVDPASQQRIENAHRKMLERRIGDQMRQAAEMVQDNHLADALTAQRRAQQQLDEVAAELGGRNSGGLESSSQSMRDLALQLDKMASSGQRTAQELKQAASTSNTAKRELTNQLQTLADEIDKLADQPSLQANQNLHDLLEQASDSVEQSIPPIEQGKFEEASREASNGADSLKQAAQAALQKAEQLKSQVAEQQMFDLRTLLNIAVKRQQPVVNSLTPGSPPQPQGASPGSRSEPSTPHPQSPNANQHPRSLSHRTTIATATRRRSRASEVARCIRLVVRSMR